MKASVFYETGPAEVLKYTDVDRPTLHAGEVLVKVEACGVNRLDIWVRSGRYKTYTPHILGSDVAGTIVDFAEGVTNLSKGERVLIYPVLSDGTCEFCISGKTNLCEKIGLLGSARNGGYAEYVNIPSQNIIKIDELDFDVAASLPVNFGTAWNALVRRARINPTDTLLIWAAGSGLGHAALQIAKLFGATVIATAGSDEKLHMASKLGADYTINHKNENVPERVLSITQGKGVDVVFDHVGRETWKKSIDCLKKGGTLLSVGVTTGDNVEVAIPSIYRNELLIAGVYAMTKDDMVKVIHLAAQRRIRPVIHKRMNMSEAAEAHRMLESSEQFGKVILKP
ncbi:MAG: zinc-binding dehydrogenase [Nitrososphaerota archaeon]